MWDDDIKSLCCNADIILTWEMEYRCSKCRKLCDIEEIKTRRNKMPIFAKCPYCKKGIVYLKTKEGVDVAVELESIKEFGVDYYDEMTMILHNSVCPKYKG